MQSHEEEGSPFRHQARELIEGGCMVVFDDVLIEKEGVASEDALLFFHPTNTLAVQAEHAVARALLGVCQVLGEFTTEETQWVKLAEANVVQCSLRGGVYILLTGGRGEDVGVMRRVVQALARALTFYIGRMSECLGLYATRAELQAQFRHAGVLLCSMLRQHARNQLHFLEALPHCPLPKTASRYFVVASQILMSLCGDQESLGGAIFFDRSLLCSHLDMETTSMIFNLLLVMRSSSKMRDRATRHIKYVEDAEFWWNPVFLTRDQLTFLQSSAARMHPNSSSPRPPANASSSSDVASTEIMRDDAMFEEPGSLDSDDDADDTGDEDELSAGLERRRRRTASANPGAAAPDAARSLPEYLLRVDDEGGYVGLFMIGLSNVTLALVMSVTALNKQRHMSSIKAIFPRLYALESVTSRAMRRGPSNVRVQSNVSVRRQSLTSSDGTMRQPVAALTFDSNLAEARASPGVPMDADSSFARSATAARCMFAEDDRCSQVVLRDHNGVLFARRNMTREFYYHRAHSGGKEPAHADFLRGLELSAAGTMIEEFKADML